MNPSRPPSIPSDLLASTEATVFTPHLGSGTVEARERQAVATADHLLIALDGGCPSGAVNCPARPRGDVRAG
jgi:lactate dehydrogenase-like 2-hydroxyacid dehydrogenase